MPTKEEKEKFREMTNDALYQLRTDLNKLSQSKHDEVQRLKGNVSSISKILKERRVEDRNSFDITDHALVRYLERCKGFDIQSIREEILQDIRSATPFETPNRRSTISYKSGKFTYIVDKTKVIVTILTDDFIEQQLTKD